MKLLVLGWVRRSGNRKQDGKAFDFAQVIATSPVEVVNREQFQSQGDGFQEMTIPMDLGAERNFKGIKFPAVLELTIDHRPGMRGQIEPVVVGVVRPAAAAAV